MVIQNNKDQGNITSNIIFKGSGSGGESIKERFRINSSGHVVPGLDSTYDLGLTGTRWRNFYADTLYGDGSNLTGIDTDLVSDTSPQLGADLDVNGNDIKNGNQIYEIVLNQRHNFKSAGNTIMNINGNGVDFQHGNNTHADSVQSRFGTGNDLAIYHDGSASYIDNTHSGGLYIRGGSSTYVVALQAKNSQNSVKCTGDGAVELYYNGNKKAETYSSGGASGLIAHHHLKVLGGQDQNAVIQMFADEGDNTDDQFLMSSEHNPNRWVLLGQYVSGWHRYVQVLPQAGVQLYYDDLDSSSPSAKLATTSSGISVTGNSIVSEIGKQKRLQFDHLTSTQRDALSAVEGEMIYNSTTNKHEVYNSAGNWIPFVVDPPTFDHAAGSLGTICHLSRSAYSINNPTATETTGSITYSISSGSLPSGLSFNTSTAAITGTANSVGSNTTSTFTVTAENQGGSVSRQYTILVKSQVTNNYSYSGSTVTFNRPTGARYIGFYMWGGAGSQGTCSSNGNRAGAGGNTVGIIDVQNHSVLYLQVAQSGQNPNGSSAGGWPNGGEGNDQHHCKGGGGGGSSNIYNSSGTSSFSNLIAVAGGGGGVSHGNPNSNGGDGGGTNGESSNRGGGGGTQNAGGSLGSTPCGNSGNAGSARQGGNAGTGTGCTNAGAGGGGGYYGGGAGGNSNGGNSFGGGGGGSGYFDTSLVSSGATRRATESGWGTNKPSGIADRPSSSDQQEGGDGHITLYY